MERETYLNLTPVKIYPISQSIASLKPRLKGWTGDVDEAIDIDIKTIYSISTLLIWEDLGPLVQLKEGHSL